MNTEISAKWPLVKLKWLATVRRGASPRPIDDPIYFEENGEYGWVRIVDVTRSGKYLKNTEQKLSSVGAKLSAKLEPGNLILSIAGSVGKLCITAEKACVHDGFVYFKNLKTDVNWLYYSLQRSDVFDGIGKTGTQTNLNTETVGNIEVHLPNLELQRQIAAFLDQETAKIDLLIEKQEKLIELLDEKLKATITEAVTKGLNPDAKMKDSGVEWIGEVPEGWVVTKFGRLAFFVKGVPVPKEDLSFEGEPEHRFLRTGDLWNPNERTKDEVFVDALNTNGLVFKSKDEMIICFDGFNREVGKGTVGFSTFEGEGFIDGMLSKIATKKPAVVSRRFLEYSAMSSISESFIVTNAQGTTAQHAGHCKGEIPLCLPSIDEQNRICQKLDAERLRITEIKKSSIKLIELLKEKRQALISEAVTGKIDLSDFPIQHADN